MKSEARKEMDRRLAALGKAIGALEDFLKGDPEAEREIVERITRNVGDDGPKTQFLKVAEVLLAEGNKPRSARWIVTATGISRSSLSQIIHRTHRESFVSSDIHGYSRKKLWALTGFATHSPKTGRMRCKSRECVSRFSQILRSQRCPSNLTSFPAHDRG